MVLDSSGFKWCKDRVYNRPRVTHSRKSGQSENRRHPTSTFSTLPETGNIRDGSFGEQIYILNIKLKLSHVNTFIFKIESIDIRNILKH